MQLQQVNEKIEHHVQIVSDKSKSPENDAALKLLDGKLKTVEKKLSQNDSASTFSKAFSSFSKEISSQLQTLNANLISSIETLVNSNKATALKSTDLIERHENFITSNTRGPSRNTR